MGLLLFGCNLKNNSSALANSSTELNESTNDTRDKDEIQVLIRQMLKWADSKNNFDLLPALNKDSICIGFDFDKVNQNLVTLEKTGFFSKEFIDNYNQIILLIDKKIKNKEIAAWNIYELPTFNFANDVNPWCLCQDNLSWDNVAIEIVKLDNYKGEIKWNWGTLDSNTDSSWKDFSYTFRVVKENDKWKISYLQGFDFKKSTK